jgi:hypothetical protein
MTLTFNLVCYKSHIPDYCGPGVIIVNTSRHFGRTCGAVMHSVSSSSILAHFLRITSCEMVDALSSSSILAHFLRITFCEMVDALLELLLLLLLLLVVVVIYGHGDLVGDRSTVRSHLLGDCACASA